MGSMNDGRARVVGGVDSHADTHAVAVLDARGVLVATVVGYRALLSWLRGFGELDRVGVESTGSYAAALTRYLVAEDVVVVEVNQPHPHTRHRRGKSDEIDAELAARHALSLQTSATPKRTDGIVESIRQLRVVRDGAMKARVAAITQLGSLLITAPAELREQLSEPTTLAAKATLCRRLRPDTTRAGDPLNAAKIALRSLARRIATLETEIRELDRQLAPLVGHAAPRTLGLLGIGPTHAGQPSLRPQQTPMAARAYRQILRPHNRPRPIG